MFVGRFLIILSAIVGGLFLFTASSWFSLGPMAAEPDPSLLLLAAGAVFGCFVGAEFRKLSTEMWLRSLSSCEGISALPSYSHSP